MFRPINGAANSEWVEVVNTGASSVDLSGWQFGKPSASAWSSALPAGTTLGPSQALNVGDNVGFANSAVLESNDDLIVGRNGGTGALRVRNDARVELRSSSNPAESRVGESAAGWVIQPGGLVVADDLVLIGRGAGGVAQYAISGGSLNTATDGSGSFKIAHAGAAGTLRISGNGSVNHDAKLYIGAEAKSVS